VLIENEIFESAQKIHSMAKPMIIQQISREEDKVGYFKKINIDDNVGSDADV
jgi:hypothetical protein